MYSVEIKYSSKELTARERIQIKDTTDTIKLDEATQLEAVMIEPLWYAVLSIHNDKAEDADYETYIVVDRNGKRYKTGSQSFWSAFTNIAMELENLAMELDGDAEPWMIKVYRMPSKNRAGKDFITCSLI